MGNRWVVLGLIVLVVSLVAGVALADTGGSMGGGDWGGGGGDGYSGGGGGYSGFVVLAGVATAIEARRRSRRLGRVEWTPPIAYAPIAAAPSASVDVTALRIAIDGRASKFVQTELEAIVKAHDAASEQGRAKRLREVSILLRRVRDSWVYGGADNEPMRPRADALQTFSRHVDDARTRVRQTPATVTSPTGEPTTLILVSIVVAARGELMSVTDLATGEDLRRALESAAHRAPEELLAVEIVWEPSEPGRTLSSIDLEASYRTSELHRLQGALVGKTFCTYCAGPFPAELVSCPHCGAPARGRERTA